MIEDYINDNDDEYDQYIKEDFCGACIAAPLASAGVGVVSSKDNDDPENYESTQFWIMIISVVIILITLGYLFYKKYFCNTCKI